uniref:Uncharacterized protein n=1 Tax=Anguilla anguilla TaxID=7936 RepID=A0A0E9XRG6_ANGAN
MQIPVGSAGLRRTLLL